MKKLMIDRYEVIADYPTSKFSLNEILTTEDNYWFYGEQGFLRQKDLDKYPHLFRKLSWWERREIGEMPEYVKDSWNNVVKAVWRNPEDWEVRSDKSDLWHSLIRTEITIATEQEYQDYLTHLTTPKTI